MQVFDKEIIKEKCKWLIMWEKCVFMLWEQGVEGSNPFAPTVENQGVTKSCNSFFHAKTENLHAICTHVLKIGCKKTKILLWIFAEK
jgi:hypothetical protein